MSPFRPSPRRRSGMPCRAVVVLAAVAVSCVLASCGVTDIPSPRRTVTVTVDAPSAGSSGTSAATPTPVPTASAASVTIPTTLAAGAQRGAPKSFDEAKGRIDAAKPAAGVGDRFQSPSGNIVCRRSTDSSAAACEVAQGRIPPPLPTICRARRPEGHRPHRAGGERRRARVQLRHHPPGQRAEARLRRAHRTVGHDGLPQRGVRGHLHRHGRPTRVLPRPGTPSSRSDAPGRGPAAPAVVIGVLALHLGLVPRPERRGPTRTPDDRGAAVAQLLLLHLLAAALAPWLAKVLRTKAFPVLALAPAVSFAWLVSVSSDVRAGNLPTQRISWVPGLGLDLDFRSRRSRGCSACSSPGSARSSCSTARGTSPTATRRCGASRRSSPRSPAPCSASS